VRRVLQVVEAIRNKASPSGPLEKLAIFGDPYPGNQNVRPKMRQQLQYLRNRGFLDFVSRGSYRLRS
jgi:type II restriction enzyme